MITSGRNRAETIARMNRAPEMFVVHGIHTSIPMHQRTLAAPNFLDPEAFTGEKGIWG